MSKFAKVEGHSYLVREESSGAIINNDVEGYQAAIRRKRVFQIQRDEINTLKNDVSDIKQLLGEILERTNGKNS
tara:strand:+ start:2828 stop:3049 length:222 start_codon:yes stop_codon:yes gene_type:complete